MFRNRPTVPRNILIVGAGIAGLSLARQLKHFKIPFTIIKKSSEKMLAATYQNIRDNGPLNIQEWRKLLATDPQASPNRSITFT